MRLGLGRTFKVSASYAIPWGDDTFLSPITFGNPGIAVSHRQPPHIPIETSAPVGVEVPGCARDSPIHAPLRAPTIKV